MPNEQNFPIPYHPTWEVVDPSKLNDFITCPRMYFYSHMLGWKSEMPNNHLVFGSAWHEAMEHLLLNGYSGASIRDAQEKLTQYYRKEFPEETDEIFSPKTPDRATLALVEYTTKYPRDFDNFEVLYTEVSGTVPITNKKIMHFRMDDVLKHVKGYYFSLEHKTGSYLNNQWRMQWPLSMQAGTYIHSLYCLYPQELVRGIEINGTFFKRTKAPLFDFERVPVWKLPHQMRSWYATVNYWINQLESETGILADEVDSSSVMHSFPMNPTNCSKYFGCPFHDFCCSWQNPLQHCFEPPLGMKVEFWDPRDRPSTKEMEFDPFDKIENMLKELEETNGTD